MTKTHYRIVWICEECGSEFPSKVLDKLTWHSWSDTKCPNGHESNVIAKVETVDHAWDAVQAWFEYHVREDGTQGLMPIDELALGVGRGYAGIAISSARQSGYFDKPLSPPLENIRNHIVEAVQTKASPENLIIAEMLSERTGELTQYVGSPGHFARAIDYRFKALDKTLKDLGKHYHKRIKVEEDPSMLDPLVRELEALIQLCGTIERDPSSIKALLSDARRTVEGFEESLRARKEEEDKRRKAHQSEARWETFWNLALLAVLLAVLVWTIGVFKTLWNNHEQLFEWLSRIEPARDSIAHAWANRPGEIGAEIKGAAIVLGAVVLITGYFILQMPLFYLLAGLGLVLSFIVYKSLWLLFAGLGTLAVGAFVFQHWLERERANERWMREYYGIKDEE